MATGPAGREEAVHQALRRLGAAPDEEVARFVLQEYGLAVEPRFLPVFRASLRAREALEQARAKARAAAPAAPGGAGAGARPAA